MLKNMNTPDLGPPQNTWCSIKLSHLIGLKDQTKTIKSYAKLSLSMLSEIHPSSFQG